MWGKIVSWTALKIGGIAAIGSYIWSAAQEKPEDRKFKNMVDATVVPAAGNLVNMAAKGIGNTIEGLSKNEGAKGAMQGAADFTSAGLSGGVNAIGEITQKLPTAGQAGEVVNKGLTAAKDTGDSFFSKFMPKGWAGWATAMVGIVGLLLGLKTGVAGDVLKNASTTLMNTPINIFNATLNTAGQVLTPFMYIGAALGAGYLLLHPDGRQLMSDAYQGVKNLFIKKPEPQPQHHHHHLTPTPEAAPAVTPAQQPVTAVDVSGVNLSNVQGGETVTQVPTRSHLSDDVALNPRRDPKNSPNFSVGA